MMKKKLLLGIPSVVLLLVFGIMIVACDIEVTSGGGSGGGYTFEFRVAPSRGHINKIEFINGSNLNAPVLQTETINIGSNEMSETYKVSGFTVRDGDEKRIFGIKVTYSDGRTEFGWGSASNNSKMYVRNYISFYEIWFAGGDW